MFTITSTRNHTATTHTGLTWPQAVNAATQFVNAATQFVNAATRDGQLGSTLLTAVQDAAGTGEPVGLPNGTTLEIDLIEEA